MILYSNTESLSTSQHVQRRVNAHLRLSDAFHNVCPISVSFHGHDDGLRSTRGHGSCAVGIIIQLEAHSYNLGLHLANSWKDIRVDWIGDAVPLVGVHDDFLEFIAPIYKNI